MFWKLIIPFFFFFWFWQIYCSCLKCSVFVWSSSNIINRSDRGKAIDILRKDLKVFASFNEELYKEMVQLLALENFR